MRLDALSSRPAGEAAWRSALAVSDTEDAFNAAHDALTPAKVACFLTVDATHPGSIVSCLELARLNARAVRTALSREAWTAINRVWLLFDSRELPAGDMETLSLMEAVKAETRGFEGAIQRENDLLHAAIGRQFRFG